MNLYVSSIYAYIYFIWASTISIPNRLWIDKYAYFNPRVDLKICEEA